MGQYDILEFLKKNSLKWYSVKDLVDVLELRDSSITMALRKLEKHYFVESKKFPAKRPNRVIKKVRYTPKNVLTIDKLSLLPPIKSS